MKEWIGTTYAFPAWTAFLDYLAGTAPQTRKVISARSQRAAGIKTAQTGICKKAPGVGKHDLDW